MGLTGALHLSAAAKVNLGLEVTGVRDDGFHELRSIIVNVDITDTITLAPGAGTVVAGEEALATPAAAADAKTTPPTKPSARKMVNGGKAGSSGVSASCAIRTLDTRAFARLALICSSIVRFA